MVVRVDEDVLRLDVAVHVTRAMDRVQGVAELQRERGGAGGRQRAGAPDERAEVVAVDVTHDEVRAVVRHADGVDRDDVRVLDGAGGARLADEPLAALGILEQLRRDHLHRHVAIEIELARAVHDPHAAPADDGVDATAAEHDAGGQRAHARLYI